MHSVGYNKYIYHIARTHNETTKLTKCVKLAAVFVQSEHVLSTGHEVQQNKQLSAKFTTQAVSVYLGNSRRRTQKPKFRGRLVRFNKKKIPTNRFHTQSSSSEATTFTVGQEIPYISWSPPPQKKKLIGVFYSSQPFVLFQDEIIPLHNLPFYFFKVYINIISYLFLILPSGLFSSSFTGKHLDAFIFSSYVQHAPPIISSLSYYYYYH